MQERYLITLYEKIPVTDNIMLFKKNRVVKNAYINFNDDFEEATFYDENSQRIKVDSMYSPYTIVSDDKYCYNYPLTIDQLKENYPDVNSIDELIKLYDSEINDVLEISFYDKVKDKVKIVTTNEEILGKIDSEELFNEFFLEYDSSDEDKVKIKRNDVIRVIKMLEKKQYKKLYEQFKMFNSNIEFSNEIVKSITEVAQAKKQEIKKDETIEEILKSLDNLTGLNNIKEEVNKLVKYLLYIDKTKKYLKLEQPNLHMLFTGNPGTGKTTVARIIGKILYKLGYLKSDKFVEITPRSLIAEYVGQTAVKTAELIEKNKGGVVFIDEAYVLASQGFGEEALVEILKELEKNETMFIFAGYKDEMKEFMELNPGLTSRVGYYLEYKDYTTLELYQIFETKVSNMGFEVDEKLKEKIIKNLDQVKDEKNFGNGRYIDKLINKIILQHSVNTENYKRKRELITLKENDFNEAIEETLVYKNKVKKLGF